MSDFLLAKLSNRNEFRTSIACELLGINISYQNLKIDTGAVRTFLEMCY